MEKDKKYNIVLGLMIFFFLIIVGGCLAWGLGYIGVKENKVDNNVINENVNSNSDEVKNDNLEKEKEQQKETLSVSDVEKLNKEYTNNYILALRSGSVSGRIEEIMGYGSYEELEPHITNELIEDLYIATDIDYLTFTEKLAYLSQSLIDELYSVKSIQKVFKEHNGKLAFYEYWGTGASYEFISQELISNKDNEYNWEVTFNCKGPDDIIRIEKFKVIGKVEDSKYMLVSVDDLYNDN